nr:heavy metal efflux pump [uncultured bacterium]
MKLAEFSVKNSLLVNLLSLFIIVVGFNAMVHLKREAFPRVDFDIVTITTVYPGAPAEDVEKLVTVPLEKELKGISGINDMTSTSEEGLSTIGIEIDPEARDKKDIIDDIETAVDRVRDLPKEIREDPIVFELKADAYPVIEISLSGDFPESETRRYAEELEDQILEISDVSSVRRIAWRDPEYWVEVDPDKLKDYHVSLDEIINALRTRNITIPGGQLTTEKDEYNVRITGEFRKPEEIEDVIIRANDAGVSLRVKDVARVIDTYEDETHIPKVNGKRSVSMVVLKSKEGDVLRVVEKVNVILEEFKQKLPEELEVTITNDISFYVKRRLGVLQVNGLIGLVLVIAILFLFLDPIPALMTAVGLPIALFSTFGVMYMIGASINLVTMLGLIIVLGMLVDDGIIVAENVYRYVEEGMDPKEAAIKGTSDVIAPVTVTILTTCAAFSPLLFMEDLIGKFVRFIPIVVMIALASSLVEAFIILPSHLSDFMKLGFNVNKGVRKPKKEKKWFVSLKTFYTRMLRGALNHRYLFLGGMILLFAVTIFVAASFMRITMFSGEGIEYFYIRAEAKKGTPLAEMNKLIMPVEELVASLPEDELDAYRTYLGAIEEEGGFDPNSKRGTHLGQISVFLTPSQSRKRRPQEIMDSFRPKLEKIKGFEKLYLYLPKEGPPVGRPISVDIKGDNYDVLQEIADIYVKELETVKGVSDVTTSYEFGKKQLRVVVDKEKVQKYYLTVSQVASSVRNAIDGGFATTIKPIRAEEEIDVLVRFARNAREDIGAFDKILIENAHGNLVPLASVAVIEEAEGIYRINHLDGKRVIAVSAQVDEKNATSFGVNMDLQKKFKNITSKYPGYTIKYGGEYEDQQRTLKNLLRSFAIAFFLIFIILAALFNSIIQPFIVMLAIPFGIVGVIFAFLLHGRPLSFFAFMGLVGLTGIVVNDSIVLVDFVNKLRKEGKEKFESLIEAGGMRLRPVLMTTITTIAGLVSVAYGIGGGDPFLKPMALAIVWGLVFSTNLTLILIPCIYAIADDFAEKILHKHMVKMNGNSDSTSQPPA